jgi:hypothetical protein
MIVVKSRLQKYILKIGLTIFARKIFKPKTIPNGGLLLLADRKGAAVAVFYITVTLF